MRIIGALFHERAPSWLEATLLGTESLGFSWSTITAFLRIATNPRAFESPLPIEEAARIVDSWFESAAAILVEPGPNHWKILRGLLLNADATASLVTDAHLAALAIENGATLVSSDRDFSRFSELRFQAFP